MGIVRIIAVCLGLALSACAAAPADPPAPGDCVIIRVWSNGFHTSFALPADLMAPDHPVRRVFPEAGYFLIGWGERDFFMDPDPGFWDGAAAILPPSDSAVQVMAHDRPVEATLWRPSDLVDVALSVDGAQALADGIAATLVTDAQGRPIVLDEGRLPGRSLFLAARPGFHIFHMCNHWTAARLAEAGVPLRPGLAFTAGGLMEALREVAPWECPDKT